VTIPDFTAEVSLYRTSRSYRTKTSVRPVSTPASRADHGGGRFGTAVVPQLLRGARPLGGVPPLRGVGPSSPCNPFCVCVTGEGCPCCPHPDLELYLARRR
jgi:hypothetical protein